MQRSIFKKGNMKTLLFVIALLAFIGCKAPEKPSATPIQEVKVGNFSISGQVEKGPFKLFTNGTVQGLNADFSVIVGENADIQTYDNLGNFATNITFPTASNVKVSFDGQYFNENTGADTATSLRLSSYVFPSTSNKNNINLVGHIVQDRIPILKAQGKTMEEASVQASNELTGQAINRTVATGSHEWGITDNSPLLAFSVLVQHGIEGAALQTFIDQMRADFSGGVLPQHHIDTLKNNATQITASKIATNVQNIGLTIDQNYLSSVLLELDPSKSLVSKHRQGNGAVGYSATLGATTRFYVPVVLSKQTQLTYASLPCQASNIIVYDSTGVVSGVYDENLQPNLSINLGNQLGTATYQQSAIPVRDYGNGAIRIHQAVFATPLDLAAGQYWVGMDLAQGCVVETFEALQAERLIHESTPNLFTFPVSTTGLNTIYLEFL
jgi:hypothetical protein